MSRTSLLKLFLFITVKRRRFLWFSLAFAVVSAVMAYMDYLDFKKGYDTAYETLITLTFNLTVAASIIFAGDLVSEDFGSNVKYIVLQLGDRVSVVFSKFLVALLATSLVGYLVPVVTNLAVIAAFKGLPDLKYVGILYLYVIAYTSLNALVSAVLYERGSKTTIMANLILWEVIYFIYTNAVLQVSGLKGIYYTSLPVLAEGLYRYYLSEPLGFYVVKPSLEYSVTAPIVVSAIALLIIYARAKNIKV